MKRQVILIMTDTTRKDMLGCYGNEDMKTPNLDRLAERGIRYENAYTCQPVCGLVQRSVEEARGRASSRHITIKNTAGDSTIKASFDFKWTQEALGNLLDNAVKYSPEGSLVTVSLQALEMFVSVTVADQGMAVGEEERAQIFERFYRGANARQTEGNGVGLYLTRMILQREGGYIKVSPGKEGGNCFCIYLPKEPLPPAVAPGTQP